MNDAFSQNGADGGRMRLGFFSYLEGEKPQAEVYAETLKLFTAADALGFDVAWEAQHHFGHHGGLPSPFVFFASLAERAPRIGVGTAIISLPLENPIRVAEDAAVFEALHPGRLRLGLGTGFSTPQVLATFGHPNGDRRTLYEDGLSRLLCALEGQPINDDGDVLNPPGNALRKQIWESPSTPDRAAEAAQRGNGLLLSRVAIGAGNRPSHELQVPLVDTYTKHLPAGVAPRVGLSRTVYPSRRPEIARRDLIAGLEVMAATSGTQHAFPREGGLAGLFAHHNIHSGSPDEVIESLQREPLLSQTTDLICQVQPGLPSLAQTLEALELIATEVAPALGWKPSMTTAERPLTPNRHPQAGTRPIAMGEGSLPS
jgi:alkanesulfonate monooxygenase SsuD/methylene tetrahydromethanopterin reductase-like flavin-dependent oxidoreductase (luciferase family)